MDKSTHNVLTMIVDRLRHIETGAHSPHLTQDQDPLIKRLRLLDPDHELVPVSTLPVRGANGATLIGWFIGEDQKATRFLKDDQGTFTVDIDINRVRNRTRAVDHYSGVQLTALTVMIDFVSFSNAVTVGVVLERIVERALCQVIPEFVVQFGAQLDRSPRFKHDKDAPFIWHSHVSIWASKHKLLTKALSEYENCGR